MRKEQIIKICESFGDRARGVIKYINYRHKEIDNLKSQLSVTEEKLKRMSEAVMDCHSTGDWKGYNCAHCGLDAPKHKPDCVVLEAQNWLEDKE